MYISFLVKVKCLLHVIDITQVFKIQMLLNCCASELCTVLYTMYYITANSRCPTISQDHTNGCEALYINLLTPGAEGCLVFVVVFFQSSRGSALFILYCCMQLVLGVSSSVSLRHPSLHNLYQYSALYITKIMQKNLKMNEDQRKTIFARLNTFSCFACYH